MVDLDGRDRPRRGDERVVAFELEDVDAVADDGIQRQFERAESIEEIIGGRLEQREVGLVIDAEHLGVGALATLGAFEFDEAVVGDELRGDEHAVAGRTAPRPWKSRGFFFDHGRKKS